MHDRTTETGIVAPEILLRAVRDAFIAERGRRQLKVFRPLRDAERLREKRRWGGRGRP